VQVAKPSNVKSEKQASVSSKAQDFHHCNCFFNITKEDEIKLFNGLKSIGAYNQRLQEGHGQKWALTYVLDDYWQLHIKMMPDGRIECEIEARIIYLEHQTIRSKPAHCEMQQLLEKFGVRYAFITPTPEPCNNRILNTPGNPTDIGQLGMVFVFGLLAAAVVILTACVAKSMASNDGKNGKMSESK
jgi:hypothetical protein